jgi:hypothetical protein
MMMMLRLVRESLYGEERAGASAESADDAVIVSAALKSSQSKGKGKGKAKAKTSQPAPKKKKATAGPVSDCRTGVSTDRSHLRSKVVIFSQMKQAVMHASVVLQAEGPSLASVRHVMCCALRPCSPTCYEL